MCSRLGLDNPPHILSIYRTVGENELKIGLIDADLLDNGTRHPNIALEKISAFHNVQGHETKLITNYNDIPMYDTVFLSKVFGFTNIPIDIYAHSHLKYGGTGFFFENAPDLPFEVEHHMPNYNLYDEYISSEIERGIHSNYFKDYQNYSIGFATRGCFRRCDFCVNKKYSKAIRHAPVAEFFDPSRKYIYLWDDNIFAYEKWQDVFDELAETGRPFQFKQGMDIRILTNIKAQVLSKSKYHGDIIFAFDYIKDRDIIENKLDLWQRFNTGKTTKLYVLVAYESQDAQDVVNAFERIKILMKYGCLAYIMRYEKYDGSPMRGMYINLAAWCNQPNFFKKMTFREFCIERGKLLTGVKGASWRYMEDFEKQYPDMARKYFDMRYENIKEV